MSTPVQPQGRAIQVIVDDAEQLPILFANAFFLQQSGDGAFILTAAQAAPPLFNGSPEEQRQQLERIANIRAKSLVRIVMTPAKLKELIGSLNEAYETYEAIERGGSDGSSSVSDSGRSPTNINGVSSG